MLSIAAVVQNEAKWLPEWLEYHALPSIGVEAFLLYDDGSSDGTERVLQRYHAAGLVWPFTTEQLRPFKNTTLIKPHTRVIIPLFKRLPGPPPHSHWCIRVEPFPQQIAMMRHAANTAATRWIAFNDVDEFVVSVNPMPLVGWLSVLTRDVGGVAMQPHIMMTERTAPSQMLTRRLRSFTRRSPATPTSRASTSPRSTSRAADVNRRGRATTGSCDGATTDARRGASGSSQGSPSRAIEASRRGSCATTSPPT